MTEWISKSWTPYLGNLHNLMDTWAALGPFPSPWRGLMLRSISIGCHSYGSFTVRCRSCGTWPLCEGGEDVVRDAMQHAWGVRRAWCPADLRILCTALQNALTRCRQTLSWQSFASMRGRSTALPFHARGILTLVWCESKSPNPLSLTRLALLVAFTVANKILERILDVALGGQSDDPGSWDLGKRGRSHPSRVDTRLLWDRQAE